MKTPTPVQLEKLAAMNRTNSAEYAAILALRKKGKRVDRHRVVKLRKAVKAAQRLERELGVILPSAHESGEGV